MTKPIRALMRPFPTAPECRTRFDVDAPVRNYRIPREPSTSPQLDLPLDLDVCRSCLDERWVEPPFDTMDPEPCPECRERDWLIWLANPYGAPPRDRCPDCGARAGYDPGLGWCQRCRARARASVFNQPASTGQLALPL